MLCLTAMHAGKLSNLEKGNISVEVFKEDKQFTCSPSPSILCKNNGIESKTKKSILGYKFIDTATSCKYYKEELSGTPMFIKYETIKGKSE
jgi:hypothetical protein